MFTQEYNDDYLCHYGVLGMKWGVRRYQNSDGTLNAKGKAKARKKLHKNLAKMVKQSKKFESADTLDAKHLAELHNYTADVLNPKMAKSKNGWSLNKLEKEYNAVAAKKFAAMQYNALTTSKGYQKAKAILDTYGDQILADDTYTKQSLAILKTIKKKAGDLVK